MTNYCVDKDVAERLVKSGWKKETKWYWINGISETIILCSKETLDSCREDKQPIEDWDIFPAPLSDEIIKVLPSYINNGEHDSLWLTIEKSESGYRVFYSAVEPSSNKATITKIFADKKLSHALANMWIWLKENKYI
ncbi:MAG: hypothetical protein PHY56_00210 [Candidatus Omnitrophica bacterium]|nr:hypothetical protein [Candidatus Omnitrophota bacterium]